MEPSKIRPFIRDYLTSVELTSGIYCVLCTRMHASGADGISSNVFHFVFVAYCLPSLFQVPSLSCLFSYGETTARSHRSKVLGNLRALTTIGSCQKEPLRMGPGSVNEYSNDWLCISRMVTSDMYCMST